MDIEKFTPRNCSSDEHSQSEILLGEIGIIKERNERVEADKAWETSCTRRMFIATVTYCVALLWLNLIGETGIYLKAVVPTGGYILSTLSLPFIKRWWVGNLRKK